MVSRSGVARRAVGGSGWVGDMRGERVVREEEELPILRYSPYLHLRNVDKE